MEVNQMPYHHQTLDGQLPFNSEENEYILQAHQGLTNNRKPINPIALPAATQTKVNTSLASEMQSEPLENEEVIPETYVDYMGVTQNPLSPTATSIPDPLEDTGIQGMPAGRRYTQKDSEIDLDEVEPGKFTGKLKILQGSIKKYVGKITKDSDLLDEGIQDELVGNAKIEAARKNSHLSE